MPSQVNTVLLLTLYLLTDWIIVAHANAGLLASTLYTFQGYACEGEALKIRCPETTTISIQFAQFGRHVPSRDMCPPRKSSFKDLLSLGVENTNCLATTSLKVVLELCQDRRHCQVVAASETFTQDPCPETRKYLEVAYKCRPNEFRSKTACEGEQLVLWCPRSMRLVIYSAMFGRTPRGSAQCPSTGEQDKDCESGLAIEAVMKKCHGRKHCSVDAETDVFGDPCTVGTRKYLTAIYTCVPKKLLKDVGHKSKDRKRHRGKGKSRRLDGQPSYIPKPSTFQYDSAMAAATATFTKSVTIVTKPPKTPSLKRKPKIHPSSTERTTSSSSSTQSSTSSQTKSSVIKNHPVPALSDGSSSDTVPRSPPQLNEGETVTCVNITATAILPSLTSRRAVGFLADWITILRYLHKNRERAILYLVLGACTGLIILLLVVIARLLVERKRNARAKLDISEPSHPRTPMRSHIDDIHSLERSDSTADVIEVVRFSPRGTLRSERTGPLSLHNDSTSRSLNNYYYG